MQIGSYRIGPDQLPLIIAGLFGKHTQNLGRGLAIIDAMTAAGTHTVKLQTYTADTMILPGAHRITGPQLLWFGRGLHEKFGFRRESYFRQHVHKNGSFHNVVGLALLRREWQLMREHLQARFVRG